MTLEDFNALDQVSMVTALLECCHSRRWASVVEAKRPFITTAALFDAADGVWNGLVEEDYLEAFSHHPKIGDRSVLRDKFGAAVKEQGQISVASEDVIERLFIANQQYEEKNGFIFIVCATGKSAEEMLSILDGRLINDREAEIQNAAGEQAAITRIRLDRMLEDIE